MRRAFFAMILLLFLAPPAQAQNFDHSIWAELLESNVQMAAGGTSSVADYAGFKADKQKLRSYLQSLEKIDRATFDSWNKNEQLAFLINAYNAWTVELITRNYPSITSIRQIGTFSTSPWQKKFIPFLGSTHSLDEIEHEMIRGSGRYNDPRIHFGVNCASIGCPALINTPFEGASLDGQLETATKAFLNDKSRNRIEDGGLKVSSIFTWYRGDFEMGWRGAETLEDFLVLYSDALGFSATQKQALQSGKMDIEFLDYDWRLNDSNVPAADAPTGSMSPIWLARSFPVAAAIIALVLLLLLYGAYQFFQRQQILSRKGADKSKA